MSETLEQRRHKRFVISLEARWDGLSGKGALSRVSDISLGGCYVESMGQPGVGERITVAIQTPTKNWLHLQSDVVSNEIGIGFSVRFVSLSDAEREVIEHLIEYEAGRSMS